MDEEIVKTELDDEWDVDLSDVSFDDEPQEEADQPEPDVQETKEEPEVEAEPETAETDQFKLKYLGEDKTVTREEATALAQKGMDYDRIRGKLDSLNEESEKHREAVSFLNELAQKQGLTIPDLIDNIRAQEIAKAENVDVDIALGRVKNQRTERDLKAEKEKLQKKTEQDNTVKADEEKRRQDIAEFTAQYPTVTDFKTIPPEVWASVKSGEKLVSAYGRYENKQLKTQIEKLAKDLEAEKQNVKNKSRTTGSQSSTGKTKVEDDIDKYWNES